MWELDDELFEAAPEVLRRGAASALTKGNYYAFKPAEVREISEAIQIPSVVFFNASSVDGQDEDGPGLRVYAGPGKVGFIDS